ncbi:DUF2971 domain-containing protein [Pseudomonas sp. EA_15y_Pfl2_R67]|uniref:DUF2971 domain-containing protein n=1 Tax=Pseudomonas sp. EA_15y_Pfl2_R67 TaxID=3088687 RepID=UPI0030D9BAA2
MPGIVTNGSSNRPGVTAVLNHLYRFRPVSSLLGGNRESELEGCYIYFSPPEKLNDPLEGHREVIWKGDSVVWENFFQHFMDCLLIRNTQYFTGKFEALDFPTYPNYEVQAVPPENYKEIAGLVSRFFDSPNVKRHIAVLAFKEREVNRNELMLHLRSIQSFAMHIISEVLVSYKLIEKGYGINGATHEELLTVSTNLLNYFEGLGDELLEAEFDSSALAFLRSDDLVKGYARLKIGESKNWTRLCIDFPEEFLTSRIRLTTSEWFVSCFMENCENSAIWGTYGNNHQGVCLKFKVNNDEGQPGISLMKPGLKHGIKWWTQTKFHFSKVSYTEKSPDLDFFCSLAGYGAQEIIDKWYTDKSGNVSSRKRDVFENHQQWCADYHRDNFKSLTVKTRHWSNEQEYRLILKSQFNSYIDEDDRKLRYNFDDLDGIIFGIKTADSDKYKLIEMVERMCQTRNREEFTFYQSFYDSSADAIRYRPVAHVGKQGVRTHRD